MMTWILLLLLWVATVTLAFIGGRFSLREEMKESDVQNIYHGGGEGPPGPVGPMGVPGREGAPGKTGPPGPSFQDSHLDEYNMTGLEWIRSVEDRIARLGRKTGMSV